MLKTLRTFFTLMSITLLSLLPPAALAARHALLIGNDTYQEVPALRNARADAEAMATALQKAGYTVTVMKDRNLKEMKDDVRNFKAHIKGGDEVIFFYSGHGVQIEAMNYLLPVDVRAESEDQVRDDALALSNVLDDLREQKPALTMAVIDACRDNPFKGTGRAIGGRGLTGVGGANGQMVIYSAGEGQQALDRLSDGDPVQNGLFTRVFIKEMTQPGVPIDQVARKVRGEVNRMAKTVNHEQVPAIYDQVIGEFYFYAQNDAGVDEVEILFWQSVKDSSDAAELQAYLDKYPDGQFSALAQARIKRIDQSNAVPGAAPVADSTNPTVTPAVPAATPVAEQAQAGQPQAEQQQVDQAQVVQAQVEQAQADPPKPEVSATAPAVAPPTDAASAQAPAATTPAQATAAEVAVPVDAEVVQPPAGPTVEAAAAVDAQGNPALAGPTVEAAASAPGAAHTPTPAETAPVATE
jgi:hypothetical protein